MSVVYDKYCTVLIALLDIQTITSLIFNVTESKSNILKKSHTEIKHFQSKYAIVYSTAQRHYSPLCSIEQVAFKLIV